MSRSRTLSLQIRPMSLLKDLAAKKLELKQTTTVVRHLGGGSSVEIIGDGEERKQPEKAHSVLIVSKYSFAFDKWLSRKHVKVLLTSKEAQEGLPLSAKSAYKHIEGFSGWDLNGLVEQRALELHREHKFTHVVALSEEDLIRAARLRQALGVRTGQQLESALRFRDKVLMKDAVAAKGLAVPTYAAVDCAMDLISFVQKHGFPVGACPHIPCSLALMPG